MQQQEGFKRFLPHLWVIAVFIAISCAFCYPAFQGKTLDQHDMKTWLWASKEDRDYHEKTGETPLWSNSMFGGMPQATIDNYPRNNWYANLSQGIQLAKHGQESNPAVFFFIAMISFYVLSCSLGINRWLGLIGGVAFAFSTYNPTIITAGHTTKMMDIALLPGIMAGMIITYRGRYIPGAALSGLFLTLFFTAGHYQIIFYSMFVMVAVGMAALAYAIRNGQVKQWAIGTCCIIGVAALAFMANAASLLQTQEYTPYSIRGGSELTTGEKKSSGLDREYAFAWSNGVGETFSILVPNLYGGSIKENIGADSHFGKKLSELGAPEESVEQATTRAPLYWGPQPLLSGSIYFGAVIFFLFILSLFIIRSPYKWWLVAAALFLILVSMGKNFPALNYFLFDHIPGFNKFRSPNMAPSVSSVVFPLLAVWALKDIFEEKISKEELWKKLKTATIITAGLCIIILIVTQTTLDYKGARDEQMAQQYGQAGAGLIKALREDRAAAATGDAFRSLVFVLLAATALWAYSKDKINKTIATAAIGLLVVIDLLPVAHRWMNSNDFQETEQYMADNFSPSPADATILQDKDPYYRVLDVTTDPFNDSKPSFFHKAIGGYQGAKMQIYQDLIEHQISKFNGSVLNMLNTKYIIQPGGQNNSQAMPRQNPGALGNAWFVSDIKWVKTANEEMQALNAAQLGAPPAPGDFNPLQTAVLRETYRSALGNTALGKDSAAYVKLAPGGYDLMNLKFASSNSRDGLAVFSDIYYPIGWKATVDGKETPIMRVNYALRAIRIPAGKHNIEFSFTSAAFERGQKLALVGSILLTLLFIAGLYFAFFKKDKQGIAPATA